MATTTEPAKRTGATQGDLWSERSGDWSPSCWKPGMRPLFEAGLAALGVGAGTRSARRRLRRRAGAHHRRPSSAPTVSGLDAAPADRRSRAAASRSAHRARRPRRAPVRRRGRFDAVTGFNSFQYAASPEAALREARRVLRPGGRLLAAVWAPPELCELAGHLAAVGRLLPPPPPGAPGPVRALGRRRARSADSPPRGSSRGETRDVRLPLRLRERRVSAARR